jgi:lipoprotein-anchoring transpeptidase ErfK/SrfK
MKTVLESIEPEANKLGELFVAVNSFFQRLVAVEKIIISPQQTGEPTSTVVQKVRSLCVSLGKFLLLYPLFLAACAANRESATSLSFPTFAEQTRENSGEISYWDDAASGGKPRIIINLAEQRAYFYRGNETVGMSVISTGREGCDTPLGEFSVIEKDSTHVSSIYGDYVARSGQVLMENVDVTKDSRPHGAVFRGAPMPYFLRIHRGIGMHAGYLPGYPASHGCIRLPKGMAVRFFQNVPIGTPVVIRQEAPREFGPNPRIADRFAPLASTTER